MSTMSPSHSTIAPHGGRLVDRVLDAAAALRLSAAVAHAPTVTLDARGLADVEMIGTGAYSPLEGFMTERDYASVVERGRLAGGLPWTIPITLAADAELARACRAAGLVALRDGDGELTAVLHVQDVYAADLAREAERVYGTADVRHPAVAYLNAGGAWRLGGTLDVLRRPDAGEFEPLRLTPKETRVLFRALGWRTVVAFQTRNPVHRAHEYIQKCALEIVDGLLLHPLVGATKDDDVPASVRLACYRALLAERFPRRRAVLAVFPAAMRYAGPREAILHAIARKNYGCTHIVIGRDHAGVGNFYGPLDAQRIFGDYRPEELGITPLFFDNTFYCHRCAGMASAKTCPHGADDRLALSGTAVRQLLRAGETLPAEFTRPEVAEILRDAYADRGVPA